MTAMVFQLLGGIGLFLLGMVQLTEGLKAVAGDALRQALIRFTGTPGKAFVSGALVTLMVQSSSATTVTLIGFVSAGLITFPQAVGVVMGASLGTTGTGWLVSVLGLKVSLGFYALPLVGIGALMRLLAHGRTRSLGLALAGFGLIFIGIETLQNGMQGLAATFDLAALPATGLLGYLVAAAIGTLMTVVMQSSSAAVATTLTALHAGAVNFDQAAAIVIGAAIGTTVTGALAAIGGSVPAKRTALTHVLFNLMTGLIAVLLLPLLLWIVELAQRHAGLEPGAVSLAAFHTTFIAIGVAIFLPFAEGFARRVERILPDRGPQLTRHLDASLLQAPPVALEASRRTLTESALQMLALLSAWLAPDGKQDGEDESSRAEAHAALEETQRFFAHIPPVLDDEPLSALRIAQLHAIDHLLRLLKHMQVPQVSRSLLEQPPLATAVAECRALLAIAREGLLGGAAADWQAQVEAGALALVELHRAERLEILHQTANGERRPFDALTALDAVRWVERVGYHVWRACHYLTEDGDGHREDGATTLDE